jgi:hypothetical protein
MSGCQPPSDPLATLVLPDAIRAQAGKLLRGNQYVNVPFQTLGLRAHDPHCRATNKGSTAH